MRDIAKLAHDGEITNIQDYIDNLLKNRSIGGLRAADIYRGIGGLSIEKLVNKMQKTKGTRARKNYVENKMKQIYID